MKRWIGISMVTGMMLTGCTKSAFLAKKPNSDIVVPSTLDDMMQLLDNADAMINTGGALGLMSGDEYYFSSESDYNALSTGTEKGAAIWDKDVYRGETGIADWNLPYTAIFYSNAVLAGIEGLADAEQGSAQAQLIKGYALFQRAYHFFALLQTFTKAYDQATATKDLGLPIKLSAEINDIEPRASLQASYDRVIADARASIPLLTVLTPDSYKNRPCRASAYALLARVYLNMRDFIKAGSYADSCLQLYSTLADYNNVSTTASRPFDLTNGELLFFERLAPYYELSLLRSGVACMDTAVVKLYATDDLRFKIYLNYNGSDYKLKSGYNATGGYPFSGLATDEVYLIRAEALARTGDAAAAARTLNTLLTMRYKTGTYVPLVSNDQAEVLKQILSERRKELLWRGQRWADLKRLNAEGAAISLTRSIGSTTYTLPAGDARWVLPIPADEIALSHIQQNPR